jgi:hypothetical protein
MMAVNAAGSPWAHTSFTAGASPKVADAEGDAAGWAVAKT